MLRILSGVCLCVSINGERESDVREERRGQGGVGGGKSEELSCRVVSSLQEQKESSKVSYWQLTVLANLEETVL